MQDDKGSPLRKGGNVTVWVVTQENSPTENGKGVKKGKGNSTRVTKSEKTVNVVNQSVVNRKVLDNREL